MSYRTLISTDDLSSRLRNGWAIVDCRYDLQNESWGHDQYRAAHIPGAVYVSLGEDMAAPRTGQNGRHPLPSVEILAALFGRLGISRDTQVIAYDQENGMYASRLWWSLRYLGHDSVAVLDGGWAKWMREGRPTASGDEQRSPVAFTAHPRPEMRLSVEDVRARLDEPSMLLVDARAPERFEGRNETIDRAAGHIPGAANHFFKTNLAEDATMLPTDRLRESLGRTLMGRSPSEIVMYCGSGVTACQNLLAMEHAGLPGARLYVGSGPHGAAAPGGPPGRPPPVSMSARGPSGPRTRHGRPKKVPQPDKRAEPISRPRVPEGSMARTVWTTLLVLATAAAVGLPAQRNRDRDFGLSQEEWCRDARRSDVCEVREETVNNTRVIDVDARGNGGVTIRGWDRPDVHVRARIVVYADNDAEAKQIASEIKLVTTGGRIRVDGPSRERNWWRDRGWSASFELEVPRNSELLVGATNGGVSVRDVRGRMDLRTVNGGISLDDVSGEIRGETTNGGVDIRLTGDKWDGPALEVRTVNGGITLALPPNLSAELDARAVNGGIHVDYPVTVSGLISSRRELRGTIGNGGPRIRASATNGGITITRR